ncbi:Asp-tRNA(Asn)/Glu-tRNA(Gln) amidotransferase subunit GatC [Nitrosophilus alvini]|uniref:Asp-tRNA(Asn)/Glu-tRNA(Gln) amidotransferase subunit GatC n=1 Tax=Nitrosophilus alvini TaxID=2714855 RepID=UPI00190A5AC0|nr:Asp-tRNA(Asn)/Glu-tRNA(Gln) amidotransferase subunit GatC [Nitrosophilus alvini]
MKIDNSLLERLEKLAHLSIEEEKKEEILEELNKFLSFVENLNELDISGLDASFTTLEGGSPFRKDEPISQEEIPEAILSNAPESSEDFFIVPKIIE